MIVDIQTLCFKMDVLFIRKILKTFDINAAIRKWRHGVYFFLKKKKKSTIELYRICFSSYPNSYFLYRNTFFNVSDFNYILLHVVLIPVRSIFCICLGISASMNSISIIFFNCISNFPLIIKYNDWFHGYILLYPYFQRYY